MGAFGTILASFWDHFWTSIWRRCWIDQGKRGGGLAALRRFGSAPGPKAPALRVRTGPEGARAACWTSCQDFGRVL